MKALNSFWTVHVDIKALPGAWVAELLGHILGIELKDLIYHEKYLHMFTHIVTFEELKTMST